MLKQEKPETITSLYWLGTITIIFLLLIDLGIPFSHSYCETTQTTEEFMNVKVYFRLYKNHTIDCICNDPVIRKVPKTIDEEKTLSYALQELIKGPTKEEQKLGYNYCIPAGGEIARYKETYVKIIKNYQKTGKIDEFGKQFLNSKGKLTKWEDKVSLINVQIKDSVAYTDFSKELYSYGGGSCRVEAIDAAIVNTAMQFPDIKKVIILVEGKEVELQP
jgi:spore germination protein GerM